VTATRVLIAGAAGRDFHNFNVVFRDRADVEVVAFTATQIPNIEGRVYPASLAGARYPDGIPIEPEAELERLVRRYAVDEVVFSYSDVTYEHIGHLASRALAAGAGYRLLSPRETMLTSQKPVVAVCAVRTGAGKSPTTRRVAALLRDSGSRVAVIRHPMPYGDLARQAVQRFAAYADLQVAETTIEEREEYEPHIAEGTVVYAGVDYAAILARAEEECDVLLWDGGNNDTSFLTPNLLIVVADPHRAGDELRYHPGETNLRLADVVVVNKVDTAPPGAVEQVEATIRATSPAAVILRAESPIELEGGAELAGRRVLAIEDGPTLTHGGMAFGAATVAAREHGAELVDPRPFAVGSIARTFETYPSIGPVLPAMGYGDAQVAELRETIERADADVVLIGTPIDLRRLMGISKPAVRVTYSLREVGSPTLAEVLREAGLAGRPVAAEPP